MIRRSIVIGLVCDRCGLESGEVRIADDMTERPIGAGMAVRRGARLWGWTHSPTGEDYCQACSEEIRQEQVAPRRSVPVVRIDAAGDIR